MKEFRKTEEGLFICEECERLFKSHNGLFKHIFHSHKNLNKKRYFDKWIKEKEDDICKICKNSTKFDKKRTQYNKTCSSHCLGLFLYSLNTNISIEKRKNTNIQRYGVENPFQSKEIRQKGNNTKLEKYGDENFNNREKCINTCQEKYGVNNTFQLEEFKIKCKQTKLEKYGDENYVNISKVKQTKKQKYGYETFNINKSKETKLEKYGDENYNNPIKTQQTCIKKYGVKISSQSNIVKEHTKQNNIKKYGVEHPNQNKEIFEKAQKSAFKLHQFKDTDIWYQGSYELDFLNKYFDIHPDIFRGPSIKYEFEGKNKVYHPDFYIPSLNLIVECKNSYHAKIRKKSIESKEKATLKNGFNYIMIVDKNYFEFISLFNTFK